MNWIFLFCGIAFLVVFAIGVYNRDYWLECVVTALLIAFVIFIPTYAVVWCGSTEIHDYAMAEITKRTPLYSTYSSDGIEGDFFLFVGSVGEESYIYYWTQRDDGAFTKNKEYLIDGAEQVVIFEEDRLDGELLRLRIPCKDYSFFSWYICWERIELQFHVPLGSIVQEFAIR